MKMQFGDVTQPPNIQAKFSHLSATLLLAWQLSPKVPRGRVRVGEWASM